MLVDEISSTCARCNNEILPGQSIEAVSPTRVYHSLCLQSLHMVKSLEDLPDEIIEEISIEDFINRTHGTRATYAKGCRGPLCRKAERDRGRNRMRVVRGLEPTDEDPDTKAREDDVLLNRYLAWYLQWRERAIQAKRLGVIEDNPLYPQGYPGDIKGNRFVKHKVVGEA